MIKVDYNTNDNLKKFKFVIECVILNIGSVKITFDDVKYRLRG